MSYKISCHTLFDITATGVINRTTKPIDIDAVDWIKRRNTQCNFDTVLQIISLRSQPENITTPIIVDTDSSYWGSNYNFDHTIRCWTFTFDIAHPSVFNNGIHELGALFADSNDVPMILIGTEHPQLGNSLNTTPENKNIHYTLIEVDHDNSLRH